jgi:hypothetical protein
VGDKQHLKYLWGGVKTNKARRNNIEESIGERLFRQRSCLPDRATERDFIGATTKTRINSLKIRKSLTI